MKKKNNKKMNKASVSIIAILALLLGVNYQDVYNFVNDNIVASVFEKKEEKLILTQKKASVQEKFCRK